MIRNQPRELATVESDLLPPNLLPETFTMKWRNWFELLLPTILVGIAWVGLSAATTVYISWLDVQHQQVLDENVASIQASAAMQTALWNVRDLPDGAPGAEAKADEFRAALGHATATAYTHEEQRIVGEIQQRFDEYMALGRGTAESTALANILANLCDQVRVINQGLIEHRTEEHRRWSSRVGGARLLLAALGPLIGVWFGFRVANRLRRRLAAIHVTLEGTASNLGQVVVEPTAPDGNLDAIDRQVHEVAGRLHQVLAELEGARREATRNERLAAVGQLAAGVAHELRNPLTAVKLLVQTAAHKMDGMRPDQLAVIQDEIARMENTIQSLLDFARPTTSNRRPCDLAETLRRAVNLVQARAEQEKIHIDLPERNGPLMATCDPEQMHQVFVNLLLNGMDAMPDGGTLTIELRQLGAGPRQMATCEVAVIDEGAGIPANLLDHIFEPFVTTKSRGTGLGLAISRRLVEEHGGRLTAANRVGKGAEFTVRLPCDLSEEASGVQHHESSLAVAGR